MLLATGKNGFAADSDEVVESRDVSPDKRSTVSRRILQLKFSVDAADEFVTIGDDFEETFRSSDDL